MTKTKVNNVNEYGINEQTNPKEMARLYNQLRLEKIKIIEMNSSIFPTYGKFIINAQSGVKTDDIVGTDDEQNYNKVSTFLPSNNDEKYNMKTLFYNK